MSPHSLLDLPTIRAQIECRFEARDLSLRDLPLPSAFRSMDRSVSRIVEAIRREETIVLVGDYDVDGVMASAVMVQFFAAIHVPLAVHIPNRFSDGYGLSPRILDRIDHADVIVTVDNGISAVEAANVCQRRGIDLIITDHHIVPEIAPEAYAIVDQKHPECSFPYAEVCGAQIAWYLCAALNRALDAHIDMRNFLEMVALAIVADMMPLDHINRLMVRRGLERFGDSEWPFIRAYRERHPQSAYSADDFAFSLAPMLNSAGRLEDATVALAYVTASTLPEARDAYDRLLALNEKRKQIEQEVTEEAMAVADANAPVIVVHGAGWHEGVVGIVAARLVRHFSRPAIVLSRHEEGWKGSGRSWGACHLYALLDRQRERLTGFGGHKAAIGMRIADEALSPFVSTLQEDALLHCDAMAASDPDILGILPFAQIDGDLMRLLEEYEPYGQGNPRPKFLTQNVTLVALQAMGKEKNHFRFTFASDNYYVQGVKFKTACTLPLGATVDIVYTLSENHFRGETSIQLIVEKINVSGVPT